MKPTHRGVITALLIGLLSVSAGSLQAETAKNASGCCAKPADCCKRDCCAAHKTALANDFDKQRYKAKLGRDFPDLAAQATDCCKRC